MVATANKHKIYMEEITSTYRVQKLKRGKTQIGMGCLDCRSVMEKEYQNMGKDRYMCRECKKVVIVEKDLFY